MATVRSPKTPYASNVFSFPVVGSAFRLVDCVCVSVCVCVRVCVCVCARARARPWSSPVLEDRPAPDCPAS